MVGESTSFLSPSVNCGALAAAISLVRAGPPSHHIAAEHLYDPHFFPLHDGVSVFLTPEGRQNKGASDDQGKRETDEEGKKG